MASVHIKSEERKAFEAKVMRDFSVNPANSERRELAEAVAARSREAYQELKRMEEKRR